MDMDMELDDEAQVGIDEEEAAAAKDDGEMEYLQELERLDRRLQAAEDEKAEIMKDFNEQIKALKSKRARILDEIENYRLGERGLPLE